MRRSRQVGAADELTAYAEAVAVGPIAADPKPVRNVKPIWSASGMYPSLALGGLDMWIHGLFGKRSPFGTMKHRKTDAEATGPADRFAQIAYPKPDGVLSFRPADQRGPLLHESC